MKTSHLASIALTLAATLTSVNSAAEMYFGGNYSKLEGERDLDFGALVIKGGYKFNESMAVEARIGFGIQDDSTSSDFNATFQDGSTGIVENKVDSEIKHLLGVYGRYSLPLKHVSPYAMAGFTSVKTDGRSKLTDTATNQTLTSESISDTKSSASFGIGADIPVGNNFAINVEYMRYSSDVDAFALGANYSF